MTHKVSQADRAAAARKIIQECPICHQSLHGHWIGLLASSAVNFNQEADANWLKATIQRHDWKAASEIQEVSNEVDTRDYLVLKCVSGGMAVLAVMFTYDLWASDWVEGVELVAPEVELLLESLVSQRWIAL